jgi:uncharacterized membrane protein YcaP (DUF421 family)
MEWHSLLFGEEDPGFLLETGIRTTVMFLVILVSLRMLGKRGIHQLSVFELGVIIGLGSAAGDPMFYKDVGLLPSMIVFVIVIAMYRVVTFLISNNEKIEALIEGKPTYILKDGVILPAFKKQPLAKDEFFEQLRQKHVSHLGQLELVIMESDGQVSIFFAPDDKVKPGLPILPHLLDDCSSSVTKEGFYSCHACGFTEPRLPIPHYSCNKCGNTTNVPAISSIRLT